MSASSKHPLNPVFSYHLYHLNVNPSKHCPAPSCSLMPPPHGCTLKVCYPHRSQRELCNQPMWSPMHKAIPWALTCSLKDLLVVPLLVSWTSPQPLTPSPPSFNHMPFLLSLGQHNMCIHIRAFVCAVPSIASHLLWLFSVPRSQHKNISRASTSSYGDTLSPSWTHWSMLSLFFFFK